MTLLAIFLLAAVAAPCLGESLGIQTGQFLQQLDHFNFEDPQLWYQSYHYEIDEEQDRDAPILVFVSADESDPTALFHDSIFGEIAAETNAIRIGLTPRFFKNNRPFSYYTTNNFKYLTIEQILSDYFTIIANVRSLYGNGANKVIAIGTGLGGSYALWLRERYPYMVSYAIASGAPLEARIEFPEFLEHIGNKLNEIASEECNAHLGEALSELFELIAEGDESKIEDLFQLADGFDVTNEKDVTLFVNDVASFIADTVRVGGHNGIEELCDALDHDGHPLNTIADGFIASKGAMRNYIYDELIAHMREESSVVHTETSKRQQLFMACNEISWFHTTDNLPEHHIAAIPLHFFTEMCVDVFGEEFDLDHITEGNENTNGIFGGHHITLTNVILVYSDLDPNHMVGDLELLNPSINEILLAHHGVGQELGPVDEADDEDLHDAKETIREQIAAWLE